MSASPASPTRPSDDDQRWMRAALALSRQRYGLVGPNPTVAAIIVRDGRILGRGLTGPGGRPHAETIALEQARSLFGSEALRGATAHITLEPCAHHGRTPPCADALIAAGITRVVSTVEDPDPRVCGQGFTRLRDGSVDLRLGVLSKDARKINAGFFNRIKIHRPWVTLKIAVTLDGRIATSRGESRWITGPEARKRVHLLRSEHDAVMIGAGTARSDDPSLDVRGLGPAVNQPVRVIADGSLSLSMTSRLVKTLAAQPVWLLHHNHAPPERINALRDLGAELITVPADDDRRLQLGHALKALADRNINRLLCEGGGKLSAALLSKGLVDRLVLFQAGRVFGGDGIPAVAGFGLSALGDAPQLKLVMSENVGSDLMSVWERPD